MLVFSFFIRFATFILKSLYVGISLLFSISHLVFESFYEVFFLFYHIASSLGVK